MTSYRYSLFADLQNTMAMANRACIAMHRRAKEARRAPRASQLAAHVARSLGERLQRLCDRSTSASPARPAAAASPRRSRSRCARGVLPRCACFVPRSAAGVSFPARVQTCQSSIRQPQARALKPSMPTRQRDVCIQIRDAPSASALSSACLFAALARSLVPLQIRRVHIARARPTHTRP